MSYSADRAIAIVGVGAVLPDALNAAAFWNNILQKRYSITEVPPERWSVADYYDADMRIPDKTYSKIGGWVRGFQFDWKRFRLPPKVVEAMDQGQQWAVTIAAETLDDYGYPERPLDTERTAVIMGTAMGGELHYDTHLRISFPEYANALAAVPEFSQLSSQLRDTIITNWHRVIDQKIPPVSEDSMPGELPNIVSGRIANVLNLRGPNFITDAACASSFAAINAAVEMLVEHHVDAVLAGGVDRNMGVSTFVKFCKIGALSATGSRPFGQGADGFVMGEGAGAFLLKRLEDAERNGDKIYAIIRGVGGSSDGKGKGITAPNPIGQQLAIQRAWENADLDPATATLIEAHGTSTRVGDVVEVESLASVFDGAKRQSIGLGSAKSNVGHLKAGAGAAGLLKATMALYHKILPPTLNADPANHNIDFSQTPFYLNHEPREWAKSNGTPRRCGVSAYGFGGTNFHLVIEEHIPGMLTTQKKSYAGVSMGDKPASDSNNVPTPPPPPRGILSISATSTKELNEKLASIVQRVESGWTPPIALPKPSDLQAKERLFIDFGTHEELLDRVHKAQKAAGFDTLQAWRAMEAQGIFRGSGNKPGKIAYLFPGQGSQYLNMGRELANQYPEVAEVFAEADAIMTPILGRPLTDYIFVEKATPEADYALMQTEITQPAMLTLDVAMYKLLSRYGFKPDMVMGHSLGEYAALIVSGIMPFAHALEAAAARGDEMAKVKVDDNGQMAAVLASLEEVEAVLADVNGYIVPANINSNSQSVIGGSSDAVQQALKLFEERGFKAMQIPVSHAFHTQIVAPAGVPLRKTLDRMDIRPPQLPLVANVTGDFYPTEPEAIKDMLQLQIASPVQWVKGLYTLYDAGVRTFIEVGPKRALRGFVADVFKDNPEVIPLLTNHPKFGELETFNQALCGLYAAGYGMVETPVTAVAASVSAPTISANVSTVIDKVEPMASSNHGNSNNPPTPVTSLDDLGRILTQALQQAVGQMATPVGLQQYDRNNPLPGAVVVSGTGLGLPGAEKPVMDPDNALRILRGEQFVDLIPERFRNAILNKHVTRLVKSEDGGGRFETISDPNEVIRLAGRPGYFDLHEEYGVPTKLIEALDTTTQLAMAAGLDALREAGIPLVPTYRQTSTGKYLPDKWVLPESLRDETGVIFASAFPGGARFADEIKRYYAYQNCLDQLEMLNNLRSRTSDNNTLMEINRRIGELRTQIEQTPYEFDRRFLFRILAMGHSQFAEYIGARGPNTQVNAACASTAQAVAIAEDWIQSGRCRRIIVIGADNVTGDDLMEWVGAGFLATGAAATDDRVDEAALPFDRRRHGTLLGMGACAMVVESEDAVRERGMRGIVELLSSETRNSAYHGTRLDVNHIATVVNDLVTTAERRYGLNRYMMAQQLVFMSHETFTPARGGSASAEIAALRYTFGDAMDSIVVANTKGFTGHPMGVGIEDVIAVKILEYGIVPPVPNYKEVDPDLGYLNLSRGGRYPVQYALHLAAGFGSQISLTLTRRIPGALDRVDNKGLHQRWLNDVSGYNHAETEVVKRVLRVKEQGVPQRTPAPSTWRYGTGPTLHVSGSRAATAYQPTTPVMAVSSPTLQPAPQPVPVATPIESAPMPPKPTSVQAEPVVVTQPEPIATTALESVSMIDIVTQQVLEIVAAQTGYPIDMLDLDLDLEADLGVDTVKQAETFAAVRAAFDIPRRDDLSLRDYPTLGHVIGFVREMRPDLAISLPSTSIASSTVTPAPTASGLDEVTTAVLQIVADQTGYPMDMLDLDLDLEADLGVDTVKQAETFAAVRAAFDIPRRDDLSLRDYPTLGHVIGFVREMRPDLVVSVPSVPSVAGTPLPSSIAPTISSGLDEVSQAVLRIVADQTGYPMDMLEFDLDLEADLGVDTVKQAETFAAVRETFNIPRRDDLSLRDYPTLGHVINFVREMRPDLAISAVPTVTAHVITSATDEITEAVLRIVAEQTGYPIDMLEFDLDLEADLGVDTVKQAETFAAVRETFSIPRRDDLSLRDYPTLGHVINFVREMRPDLVYGGQSVVIAATSAALAANPTSAVAPLLGSLEDADRVPRRVPVPSLRPTLDICKHTQVQLSENSRVIVMLDHGGVGKSLVERLEKRGVTVLMLEPDIATDVLNTQIRVWLDAGPIQGVYWLPALDVEPNLEAMDIATWRELNRVRVKNLYTVMHLLYEAISTPETFLIAATRLGGMHGYNPEGATAPLGGGVVGFTKAYKRERTNALVKAIDFENSRKTAALADILIAETLSDPGVVEVGYVGERRHTITLIEDPAVDGNAGMVLDKNTVFVVTGAAGGITSAIVGDLAAASGGIFYLLDLVQAPPANDPYVQLFRQDKEALKRQLIDDAKARGERPTPVQIDKTIMAIERQEAALRAVEAVESVGGIAHYHSVNLLDHDAIVAIVEDVRQRYGRIDVLIHAGGLEISRALSEKEANQFNLVYDVKADGFFSLLKAAQGMPIGATIVFSSVAGRFGNSGQTDYSAANDLLGKMTSGMRSWRPETRAIAIDWTAWGGIGMATRGSIPKIMEMAGIDMLPPEAGIPTVRRELVAGGFRGEIVVGLGLGMLVEEWDESGGLDTQKSNQWLSSFNPPLLMVEQLNAAWVYGGLEVQTTLDPNTQPFLYDHQIDDTPVLPGVMGIQGFAELVSAVEAEFKVHQVANVQFLSPFKFYRMEPQKLHFNMISRPANNGKSVAHTMLRSYRALGKPELPPQEKVHFTADVILSKDDIEKPTVKFTPPAPESLPITADRIYQIYFHGPAYQVMESASVDGDNAIGLMALNLPNNSNPNHHDAPMSPRLIEFCFQTAGIWEMKTKGVMALPMAVEQVTTYRLAEEAGDKRLYVMVKAVNHGEYFNALVIDESGNVYVELKGYRTVQLPGTVNL